MSWSWLETKIPPPLVGGACALAMYLAALPPADLALPRSLRLALALGFAAAGLAVDLAGLIAFRRARTTVNPLRPGSASSLVREGIYRRSRNPMYLGMLLVLAGWAAWLANPLALLGLPAFVLYIGRFQIVPEERALSQRFGAEFERYRAQVRRWL